MKKIYWKLYFKLKGLPHREEIKAAYAKKYYRSKTIRVICCFYSYGDSLEWIAEQLHITRERVRQILNKVHREFYK